MLAILLVLTISSYLVLSVYFKAKRLPPGPTPFPLLGNIPQLAYGLIQEGGIIPLFQKWRQEYGDVYTWWMGPMPTVSICDHTIANEAMVKKGSAFVSRPFMYIMDVIKEGRGVIMSNGQHWTEQRRFSLHTLRNFGLGRSLMQDRIMLEYEYRTNQLDQEIESAGGSCNFDPSEFVELTVGNIINRMLFSQRFTDEAEKEFFTLKKTMDDMIDNANVFDFMMNEWISKVPGFKQRFENFQRPIFDVLKFIQKQIEERKKEIKEGKRELRDEGEDFVDAFLIHMSNNNNEDSFDEATLQMTLLDLWLAGQETTATTLYWALTYLILHPEVVQKVRKERDTLTGRNRYIELGDKPKTPYLNATISEVLRVSSIVPLNLLREAVEDVPVGDFVIPKGTAVTAQLSVLMADKRHFEDPEKFNPDRFLGNGTDQYVVSFGLGKRSCLGESLARAELYLILGNLLLTYNLAADPSHPASMKPRADLGGSRKAQRFHVTISKRT